MSRTVCIIGLGPWGLCSLERLVDAARSVPETDVTVHVVEPDRPGGGLYAAGEPDYFVLNTPCGQHSMYPFPELVGQEKLGLGFFEWAKEKGYLWDGLNCRLSVRGAGPAGAGSAESRSAAAGSAGTRSAGTEEAGDIGPHDFLPRRLMGEYLRWFYDVLLAEAPPNLVVRWHETATVDIEPAEGGRERVHLQDGRSLLADHVVITTGHLKGRARGGAGPAEPYPSGTYVGSVRPGDRVAVEGMGLVALDVITALTTGLGGTYARAMDGTVVYLPSGREPKLYMYSRHGYPYCAKPFGSADPVGRYKPAICTEDAVRGLKTGPGGAKRQLDARRELLPLVFAEMELCYYTRAAEMAGGEQAGVRVHDDLLEAWAAGNFDLAVSRHAAAYGDFSAAEHFFAGRGARYEDADDYEERVYGAVRSDLVAALSPGGSPLKAAYETLRALRDTIRLAVEFKGLTLGSHLDFQRELRGPFARLVAGPPAFRSQQLLALMDAGVLSVPFGPAPEVSYGGDGRAVIRSTRLERPVSQAVDLVVRAHLEAPALEDAASSLVGNLVRRGRLRPLDFDGTPAGAVDIDEEFHPLDREGNPAQRLWVFGVLSEGARYFTLYIPSPKSRSRAFVDAGVLARRVAGEAGASGAGASGVGEAGGAGNPSGRQGRRPRRPLRVGLVNNMPDAAFQETESRWVQLLSGDRELGVALSLFTLPGIRRGPDVQALIEEQYLGLEALEDFSPDALVVTGAEPTVVDLREEPFWGAMEELLWWARSEVPSMLLSCMSAHAALLSFDGVNRRLRLEKCSGVFAHALDEAHPLMAEVANLSLPHSRFNEVPPSELEAVGFRVLASSGDAGWAVAVGERDDCEVLLFQGHPEYTLLTLLREYRRDVRRYLSGTQGFYPSLPVGYLGEDAVAALARFEALAKTGEKGPALMDEFPFELAASQVTADWEGAARKLMRNWLSRALERAGARQAGLAPVFGVTP